MEKLKRNKGTEGITLVALVVTIVVLLILAGVALNLVLGNNGIIKKATDASQEHKKASDNEQKDLANIGDYITSAADNWTMHKNADGEIEVTNGKVTMLVGDYVNYDETAGVDLTDTTKTQYRSMASDSGYGSEGVYQEFNLTSYTLDSSVHKTKWRVLGAENGRLMLISSDIIGPDSGGYEDATNGNKYYYLKGQDGYSNSIQELDNISKLYGQGTYASSARNVNVDDINRVTGYNPNNTGVYDPAQTGSGTKFDSGDLDQYENQVTYYWDGTEFPYYRGTNGVTGNILSYFPHSSFTWYDNGTKTWKNVAKSETATTEVMEEITTIESSYYDYYPNTLLNSSSGTTVGIDTSSKAYDCLFARTSFSDGKKYYWLGSQYAKTYPYYASWGVRLVISGYVSNTSLSASDGPVYSVCFGVRPAVYLKSGIQFEKYADGVWQMS